MPFLFFFAVIAFILQLVVLYGLKNWHRKFRFWSLLLMEAFPFAGVLYYAIRQPSSGILGWEFSAAMCLWIAVSILFGYLLAWLVYTVGNLKTKR